ncbi:hypothetical protein B0H14DRAFT_3657462 [Mycena olivaceomarginata]|nr:hypothetical protein B0H14DRAFT_3657462 [Mycena olivaceomarginata]
MATSLLPPPTLDAVELERCSEPIILSANRDPMMPCLFYATDHPQIPKPNTCIVFEIDLSLANMERVKKWEDELKVPNFATDEDLDNLGFFEINKYMPVFSREKGSLNAWDDSCQLWLTPAEMIPEPVKNALRSTVEAAMGDPELITREAPVCSEDGSWTGGILLERTDVCKAVKAGTRCYTLANSYQSPKEMWSPTAASKVNGSFSEHNLICQNLIQAVAQFGIIGLEQGPPEVVEVIKNHTSMLNIPPLGIPGNFGYQTLQINVAPAEPFGSTVSLANSMGEFGVPHRDKRDSPAKFTNMTMASRLPDGYYLGLNFCGLNIHGGSPPMAPEGVEVAIDAVRLTCIQYPPAAMGDGTSHLAVAALPGGSGNSVLKMTAEMQHLDCESRRYRAFSTQANFAQDGEVVNDTRSHVTFMVRLLLLLVIWIVNQMPFAYQIRVDSDQFLGAFSFQVKDKREAVGVWENGPGFRSPGATHVPHDGSTLVPQDAVRSLHKRAWRLHYNKYARHILYAAVSQMGYPINNAGILLEDLEPNFDGVDHRGNPIEKGGRPWKKPTAPETQEKAKKRKQAKLKKLAEEALLAGATGLGLDVKGKRSAKDLLRRSDRLADASIVDKTWDVTWKSPEFSNIQEVLSGQNPRAEGFEVAGIKANFAQTSNDRLDDASLFMLESVEFSRGEQAPDLL